MNNATGGRGDREACFAVQQTQCLRDTSRGMHPLEVSLEKMVKDLRLANPVAQNYTIAAKYV